MRYVTLEVPLSALALGRRAERYRAHYPGVGLLADSLDRPTLASGVAALEDHDDVQALVDNPVLQTHELHLQALKLFLVAPLVELLRLDLVTGKRGTDPPRIGRRHGGDAIANETRARGWPVATPPFPM